MNQYLAVLSAGVTTFAVTNIDDVFLLTFFFARRIPTRRIVTGQFAGFAAIVGISLIGVWGALSMPHRWIRLLGVLPLAIGIKRLLQTRRAAAEQPSGSTEGVASIALLTVSNGADNIVVYVPFFVMARSHLGLILIEYAAMVSIWCFVGRWLGSHDLILRSVDKWGRWAVPLVFVGLGIRILSS